MKKLYFIAFLFCITLQAQTVYEINVPENRFQIDNTNKLVVCKIDLSQLADLSSFDTVILSLDDKYEFETNPGIISHQKSYVIKNNEFSYQLFFSVFPLISINTDLEIIDEPKRLANFIYADEKIIKTSFVGIELRGGFSQTFPKKTYDLEFWEDEEGIENKDMQFGTLREDDDWILDALYNEPLRLRAYSSHQLWLDIHKPYYIAMEEDAKSGAGVMYADLFLNKKYIGVYMLSEQVDKKQLQLKSFNGSLRGELYKGDSRVTNNVIFEGLPDYDNESDRWGGYELKLPDSDEFIDWSNLYNFTDFVINSELQMFRDEIQEKLHTDNAIDYFIFLNLLRATDNVGKNIYTAKYTHDEPYFFAPWDLDGVFGTNWRGDNDGYTEDILSNGLFDRLIHLTPDDAMKIKVNERWFKLREGVLSDENLNLRLTGNYNLLKDNMVYARERMIWQNYSFDESSKNYMDNWLLSRLAFLDGYFGNLLDVNHFNDLITKFIIYPNPTTDFVYVKTPRSEDSPFRIYDTHGTLLFEGVFEVTNPVIDLKNLSPGIYFLRLYNSFRKVIIK